MAWVIPAITAAGSLAGGTAAIISAVKTGGGTAKTIGGGPIPYTPSRAYNWLPTPQQQATGMPDPGGPTAKKQAELEAMGAGGLANPFVGEARGQQGEMRSKYLDALELQGARARGENSVVLEQARVERDRAQHAFASQLATMSGQGYYNPAAQRATQMQSSGLQQSLAGTISAARSKEVMDAQSSYLQAIAAGRGQDLSQMMAELEQEKQRQAFFTSMAGLSQGYAGMDLQNKLAQQAGQQSYEQFLAQLQVQNKLGNQQGEATSAQLSAQQNLANQELYTKLGVGGINAGANALAKLGLDPGINQPGGGQGGQGGQGGAKSWWPG